MYDNLSIEAGFFKPYISWNANLHQKRVKTEHKLDMYPQDTAAPTFHCTVTKKSCTITLRYADSFMS